MKHCFRWMYKPPSPYARCTRMVGNWLIGHDCGEPLQLVVTKSPVRDYEELIVIRCAAGHIQESHGVLSEVDA